MPGAHDGGAIVKLPRGGTVVRTSAGLVQFAAPPETLKDALRRGLEVPAVFVLPETWFSWKRGVTLAELEFPIFYNFFLKGRRVTAVCDEDGRARLMAVLKESVFPEEVAVDDDYDPACPPHLRADLMREMEFFRRKASGEHFTMDEMVEFVLYDERGRVNLPGGVEIRRVDEDGHVLWQVVEKRKVVAEVEDESEVAEMPPPVPSRGGAFSPPAFGITVLGASHGFDPDGKTTGFVVWVHRRGILVDPPMDTMEALRAAGVPPRHVDSVILTHCHADHDAGVFQKVLEEGRVNLYTTPTILGSFLRKYVALTGAGEERLRRLFVFRPVVIGAPIRIHGAEFRFFYSLHSIPTVGFACYLGGKSFYYSADTMYDPPRIEAMHREGLMSRPRRDALLHPSWHHSLLLHEAGVPPIHTPAAQLAKLPDEIKMRMRVLHIAEKDLPADAGLELARTGFQRTIVLPVEESAHAAALEVLDALAGVDLLGDLPISRGREFLTIARRETFAAGTLLIGQGEAGDHFYIVLDGEAVVLKDGAPVTRYGPGDFFGEAALVTGAPRSADVRAKTELEVLSIHKYDFLAFLRDTDLADALVRLASNRELPSWQLMDRNAVLRGLTMAQRTQLQALLVAEELSGGQVLWTDDADPEAAWLLESAEVRLEEGGRSIVTLGEAALVGDIERILKRGQARPAPAAGARAVVTRGGRAFRIAAGPLAGFLENNPRVLLALSGCRFVE